MSDARAATDAEIAGYKRARLLDASVPLHAFGPLLTRISADAARIRELEARQVPDGWQVVPKVVTRAMHDASDTVLSSPWGSVVIPGMSYDDFVRQHEWAAMLAAAPRP